MSKPSTVARTSAVALAAALAWGPAVGAAGAAPACGAFHRVPAPSPGTLSNEVDAVAAASPHAAWAVGNWSTASKEGGLILRFDGHSWKAQKPGAAAGSVQLQGVDALSASDVWAVGQQIPGTSGFEQTITLHWNGTAWSRIPSPNVGTFDNSLHDVVAIAHDDVWAVGNRHTGPNASKTLIEHWNGSSWSVVPSPSPGSVSNFLSNAEGGSADDIWAVGGRGSDTTGLHGRNLALHWNGAHWSIVPTPNVGNRANELFGVAEVDSNDVWAVGVRAGGSRNLALHWNGGAWKVVPTPNVGNSPNDLEGVAAVSATSVWAIGGHLTGGLGFQGQVIKWNGHAWVDIPIEQAGSNENGFFGIARIPGTRRLWGAGVFANGETKPSHPLIEQAC